MKWIDRFNTWYDGLAPVPRLMMFLGMMALAIIPLQVGMYFGHDVTTFIGLGILILMGLVAAQRANALGGRHKTVGLVMNIGMAAVVLMVIALIVLRHKGVS